MAALVQMKTLSVTFFNTSLIENIAVVVFNYVILCTCVWAECFRFIFVTICKTAHICCFSIITWLYVYYCFYQKVNKAV